MLIPKNRSILFTLLILVGFSQGNAQELHSISLDSCLAQAQTNYPQIQQYNLLTKATDYSLENAQKGNLPQVSISGQATYQSAVTSLPGGVAMGVPALNKDQYKLYGEINQPLTDLAVIKQQQKIIKANGEIDKNNLEINLYKINERVSDLFFGILLIQNQLSQTNITKSDLENGLEKVKAAVKYGTALRSSEDVLQAELLSLNQRIIEQVAIKKSYLGMLGLFIGQTLDEKTTLTTPEILGLKEEITRPELRYFNNQIEVLNMQSDLLKKNNLPKFNLFFQGGMGRPALNMLSNDFAPYYIGGLRLSWRLSNYYTASNQKQIYSVNQDILSSEKETFLFNTKLTLDNQQVDIEKIKALITQDDKIIALRERIIVTSKNQLENGVITSNDYKDVLLDADKARQNLANHKIQLIKIKYNYNLTSGL